MKLYLMRSHGGLGNQLFQYAAARAMASRFNLELIVDHSRFDQFRSYQLYRFAITARSATARERACIKIYTSPKL